MIKVSILYPKSDDSAFDLGYYADQHFGLLRERLGAALLDTEIDEVLDGPYHAVGHLMFDSLDDFNGGMSEHGKEIMADIPNYTDTSPVILVSRVLE